MRLVKSERVVYVGDRSGWALSALHVVAAVGADTYGQVPSTIISLMSSSASSERSDGSLDQRPGAALAPCWWLEVRLGRRRIAC